MAVTIKITVLGNVTACSVVDSNRRRVRKTEAEHISELFTRLHAITPPETVVFNYGETMSGEIV
jgi:hypothetical protein